MNYESYFLLVLNPKIDVNVQEKHYSNISLERKLTLMHRKNIVLMSDFKILV